MKLFVDTTVINTKKKRNYNSFFTIPNGKIIKLIIIKNYNFSLYSKPKKNPNAKLNRINISSKKKTDL
jgi:hypothetical protein